MKIINNGILEEITSTPVETEQKSPLLGLASNRQLIDELRCRIELDYYNGGMGLGYSTVGGRSYSDVNQYDETGAPIIEQTVDQDSESLRRENELLKRELRRMQAYEDDYNDVYPERCRATSEYMMCVFYCNEDPGHEGSHHGDTAGMIWEGESNNPKSVIANPPKPMEVP